MRPPGLPPQVVWDLMTGEPRALVEIKELELAKNLKYDVSRDGGRVVAWCTDSVPFPNLVVLDIMSQVRPRRWRAVARAVL